MFFLMVAYLRKLDYQSPNASKCLCTITFSYIDKCFSSCDIESELHEVFVMQQLLAIAAHMDLSDEVGRCEKYSCMLPMQHSAVSLNESFLYSQEEIIKTCSRDDGQSEDPEVSHFNTS